MLPTVAGRPISSLFIGYTFGFPLPRSIPRRREKNWRMFHCCCLAPHVSDGNATSVDWRVKEKGRWNLARISRVGSINHVMSFATRVQTMRTHSMWWMTVCKFQPMKRMENASNLLLKMKIKRQFSLSKCVHSTLYAIRNDKCVRRNTLRDDEWIIERSTVGDPFRDFVSFVQSSD